MANEIRTRPPHQELKILDRTAASLSHIKDITVKSKAAADQAASQDDRTVQEYASGKLEHGTEAVAGGSFYRLGAAAKRVGKTVTVTKRKKKQEQTGKRESKDLKIKTKKPSAVKDTKKSIKTAEYSGHEVIRTSGSVPKRAEEARKLSAIATERARQAVKHSARTITFVTKKAALLVSSCIKAIAAALGSLITALGAGGGIAAFILILVVIFGGVLCLVGGSNVNASLPVSTEVEAYEPLIRQYAQQYDILEYVELIKAVMMQESGGRGSDPMQSSEGAFNTRYPREPNGITDPEYSIRCGVQELANCLEIAQVENPVDMEHIRLALQGYNFGSEYITWAKNHYGGYTAMNAAEYSEQMAQSLGWESYGDKQYVPHVLQYYPFGRVPIGMGDQAIVQVALSQEGNVGGQPYWSWYGFDGRVEWCACFVSWCAEQCGYIDVGIVPKFSLCSDGASWFAQRGQFRDGSYVPASGDIIFFDWEGDGDTDHVGIVESVVDGIVYTIEGNSSDMCRRRSYALGESCIYGYGIPGY